MGLAFLRLGATAFGGPAAHVALMRDEFVRRRRWLDDAAFLDLVGAANLIPGPTSTELAMHLGYRRAGWPGFAVAGIAFIAPAVLAVGVLAWLYVEAGTLPAVDALLAGVAPVVVAVVAHAGLALARSVLRGRAATILLLAGLVLAVAGVPEIVVLLGLAIAMLASRSVAGPAAGAGAWLVGAGGAAGIATAAALAPGALAIAWTFARIGAVLFGSGYVLVSLLRTELVTGLGWLTERQLLDAVAVGQATPGPLFSTATFIGYLVAGPVGAAAATIGMFAPAFVAVAISIPVLERLASSERARAFRDGVNVAAVALIAVVAVRLAMATVADPVSIAILVVALVLLARGVGAVWLIGAGALVGLLRSAIPV